MKPTAVDGGPAALAAMRQAREADEPYSLVLLDVLMPGMDGFEVAEWIQRDAELAGTAIMMLSFRRRPGRRRTLPSGRRRGLPPQADQESELLETILEVLGLATPARAGALLADTPTLPPPAVRLRILLAEDTPVNQRLAVTLLEDRGHTVVVANDGQEALDILVRDAFDLILMDVQMPRMDGFQATAAIRAGEADTGRRIPILAMTAHAMKGDRERCLAAGMDGYISKPIRRRAVPRDRRGTVPHGGRARAEAGAKPGTSTRRAPPWCSNRPGALARVGGKRPLLRKMAALFLADCPGPPRPDPRGPGHGGRPDAGAGGPPAEGVRRQPERPPSRRGRRATRSDRTRGPVRRGRRRVRRTGRRDRPPRARPGNLEGGGQPHAGPDRR